jgi:hypothetical protein
MKNEILSFGHVEMSDDAKIESLKAMRKDKNLRPVLMTVAEYRVHLRRCEK